MSVCLSVCHAFQFSAFPCVLSSGFVSPGVFVHAGSESDVRFCVSAFWSKFWRLTTSTSKTPIRRRFRRQRVCSGHFNGKDVDFHVSIGLLHRLLENVDNNVEKATFDAAFIVNVSAAAALTVKTTTSTSTSAFWIDFWRSTAAISKTSI